MGNDQQSLAIIRAVIGLGASLDIATTAEGVETREQFDCLRDDGCTEVQGYYISRAPARRRGWPAAGDHSRQDRARRLSSEMTELRPNPCPLPLARAAGWQTFLWLANKGLGPAAEVSHSC